MFLFRVYCYGFFLNRTVPHDTISQYLVHVGLSKTACVSDNRNHVLSNKQNKQIKYSELYFEYNSKKCIFNL